MVAAWLATVSLPTVAQDATWLASPGSSNFNSGGNWSTGSVPTGTANFGSSTRSSLNFSTPTTVGTLSFNSGAPAYSFTTSAGSNITLNGAGILSGSANSPTLSLTNDTRLIFQGGATGGNARLVVPGNATLDISGASSGVTVGSIEGSGSYVLGSKQLTIGGNNLSTTVGGAISGTDGSLVKTGTGTVWLASVNTYSGPTVIRRGALQISVDSSLGTGDLIFDGGTLSMFPAGPGISTSRTITLNAGGGTIDSTKVGFNAEGSIVGSGSLTVRGAGVRLSGSNSYSGGTIISSGATLFANTASLQGNILDHSVLNISQNFNGTLASNISGSGALTVDPVGFTVTLSGTNSYSGGTTLSRGTLRGTTDSLQGNIANSGTVVFDQSTSGIYAGNISGIGTLTKLGNGTVILTGANAYEGTTTISEGTLQVGSSGVRGSLGGRFVTNNANLTFANADASGLVITNATDATTIFRNSSTAGSARIGSGAIKFLDDSSAGTALLFVRGSLLFTGSSTAGSAGISVAPGSSLVFQGNASGANATVDGDGTIDISGLASSGTSLGSIDGGMALVLGNKQLTIGAFPLSMSYSGIISGLGGSLVKVGSDSLTIGPGGVGTYTGGTTVRGGALIVNGRLASGVTVESGGTLAGIGTITGNTINRGTLELISPLTVNGSYSHAAGAVYRIGIPYVGAAVGLIVNGTAALSGGTVQVTSAPTNFGRSASFAILTASGGVSGMFSGVSTSLAFLTPSLGYDANNVYLILGQAEAGFGRGAQTANQRAVGSVLDRASATASGDFATVLNALYGLDSAQGPRALDAIGGQNYAGFGSVAVLGAQAFMNNFSDRIGGGSEAGQRVALAQGSDQACGIDACDTPPISRWGAWGGGFGGTGNVLGDTSTLGFSYALGGFSAGLDYRFDSSLLAGITAGYANATQYTQRLDGRGTTDSFQVGLYGSYTEGALYLDALLGYARGESRMQRTIVIPGLAPRTAYSNSHADQLFGQLEVGWRIPLTGIEVALIPFTRLQGSTSSQAGFSEWGANSLNLTVAPQTTSSLRTVVGSQMEATLGKVNFRLRAGWSHEFADTARPVTASFAGAPSLPFTTQGPPAPRDGAVAGIGLNAPIGEATRLYARYDGELQGGNDSHLFSAGVRIVW